MFYRYSGVVVVSVGMALHSWTAAGRTNYSSVRGAPNYRCDDLFFVADPPVNEMRQCGGANTTGS